MRFKKADLSLAEADMTPMIDIVFQLLTFFMIVTNFENTKADERVKLPLSELAKPPEVKPDEEMVLNIGFDRNFDGTKKDEEAYIFYAGEPVPVLQFGPYLEQERQIYAAKYGKTGTKNVTVVIRADAEVPTGLVQDLIKMAQEKQFEKFALKAQQDTD